MWLSVTMSSRRDQGSVKKQDASSSKQPRSAELTEELAALIKQTLASEMTTFNENVTMLIKDSIKESLAPIEKTLTENSGILRSLKEQMDTHAKKFTTVFGKVDSIQASLKKNETDTAYCIKEIAKLREDLIQQEDRSRRNNLRLINLPAGAEGDDPRGYIQKMLPTWIPSLGRSRGHPVEIDRAHRIYSNNNSKPQTMIFRLLRYTDRQAILEGARKAKPTLADGTPLWFYPDYSAATSRKRRGYNDIRAKLRKRGVEAFLIYPAILKVKYNGKKMSFETPKQAEDALAAVLPGHPTRSEDEEEDGSEKLQHVDSDSG